MEGHLMIFSSSSWSDKSCQCLHTGSRSGYRIVSDISPRFVVTSNDNRTDFGNVFLDIGVTVAILLFTCVSETFHIVTFLKGTTVEQTFTRSETLSVQNILFKL